MKSTHLVMFLTIGLLGIIPATSIAQPFVVLGADTIDTLDNDEVFDQATGLIWKRCTYGQFWNGVNCGVFTFTVTHEEALRLASLENAGDPVKKWRLPNIKELSSIVDRTQFDPSIDSSIFPSTRFSIPSEGFPIFWSSTPDVQDPSRAFGIFFGDGDVNKSNRSAKNLFRLVRESDQFIK